ncbi:MAG: hypothetical protein J5742_00630 [Alphaproteobacteria bacterium]|nr:hypothetical protein [Alphaproteobacteria bacterium]
MKKILLTSILAIVTGITIANADGDKKVTSKNYVDTQIGTRQEKIPAANTNSATPGSTVVTYTSTAGTIGERGIINNTESLDTRENSDKLVTAGALSNYLLGNAGNVPVYDSNGYISDGRGIYDGSAGYDSSTDADKLVTAAALVDGLDSVQGNLPTVTTSKLTCVDSPSCTLWTVADQDVYGELSPGGAMVAVACLERNASCSSDSQCCDDMVCNGGKCKDLE